MLHIESSVHKSNLSSRSNHDSNRISRFEFAHHWTDTGPRRHKTCPYSSFITMCSVRREFANSLLVFAAVFFPAATWQPSILTNKSERAQSADLYQWSGNGR